MNKHHQFSLARKEALENLKTLQMSLIYCVEEGMADPQNNYYNEILGLMDDITSLKTWDELTEAITKAKNLETDIAVWLALQGKTTVSFQWPKKG